MVVYLLQTTRNSYKVLLVIRSLEQKEIDKKLEEEIKDLLFDHPTVRAFKPSMQRPYKHQLTILALLQDMPKVPGAVRIVSRLGGWFDSYVGARIYKGVEHITFFIEELVNVGRIIEEYGREGDTYKVVGVEVGKKYLGIADVANDPYYLISILMGDIEGKKSIIEKIIQKAHDLLDPIKKQAWWLIPLLKEILRWTSGSSSREGNYVV